MIWRRQIQKLGSSTHPGKCWQELGRCSLESDFHGSSSRYFLLLSLASTRPTIKMLQITNKIIINVFIFFFFLFLSLAISNIVSLLSLFFFVMWIWVHIGLRAYASFSYSLFERKNNSKLRMWKMFFLARDAFSGFHCFYSQISFELINTYVIDEIWFLVCLYITPSYIDDIWFNRLHVVYLLPYTSK